MTNRLLQSTFSSRCCINSWNSRKMLIWVASSCRTCKRPCSGSRVCLFKGSQVVAQDRPTCTERAYSGRINVIKTWDPWATVRLPPVSVLTFTTRVRKTQLQSDVKLTLTFCVVKLFYMESGSSLLAGVICYGLAESWVWILSSYVLKFFLLLIILLLVINFGFHTIHAVGFGEVFPKDWSKDSIKSLNSLYE